MKNFLLFFIFISLLSFRPPGKIVIAAASDLRFAMDSIVAIFKKEHPAIQVQVIYGASGKLYEQICQEAPFDIFFSADADYPEQLKQKNKTSGPVKIYGTGRLVLWSRTIDPAKGGINILLDKSIHKIAIANPQHAPYGKRAEESLQYYKLYDRVKSKLVMGENIAQTAQYLTSGAADIGFVALSLALSPNMQQGGKYWLVPAESHRPLQQAYVIPDHAKGNADAVLFTDFFSSGKAAAILQHFGFNEK